MTQWHTCGFVVVCQRHCGRRQPLLVYVLAGGTPGSLLVECVAQLAAQRLKESMMETQTQLHGLGIMEAGDVLQVRRRRSADATLPAPQDCRHPRRSSLPERIVATAALRPAQLASLEHSTRVYVGG